MCILKEKKQKYSIKDEFLPYLNSIENNSIKVYIEQRMIGQMLWYDKKSTKYQSQYKKLTIISMILSAIIPVIILFNTNKYFIAKLIVSLASSAVTIITGILSLYKSKDLWLEYRNSCELLKSLLHKYFTNTDMFCDLNDNDKNKLLISNAENLMTHEIKNWIDANNKNGHQSSINS